MRGHIKKRGNNWSVIIEYPKDPITGKRNQKWFTVKGDKKDAEKFLTEKLRDIDTGTINYSNEMYLKNYMEYWYENYCIKTLKISTYEGYKRYIDKYITPYFENVKLNEIKPININNFYNYCKEKGLSNTTILQIHRILHCAFEKATKWQITQTNVFKNVDAPKPERYKATVYTVEQTNKLVNALKNSELYIAGLIAIYTGMRRGEVLALTWQDIDLINGNITVCKTLSPTKTGLKITTPKTAKSNRKISISDALVKALQLHKEQQEETKHLLKNLYIDKSLVICQKNGDYFSPTKLDHAFSKLLAYNNLPHIRFHDLRHTHASLLLSQGVQPKHISERLGHSTTNVTLNIYAHTYEADNKEVANNFENLLTCDRLAKC